MARTSTRVSFGLFALEIKQDAHLSTAAALQPFSKLNDLRTDNATARPYASYEPNFWLLGGQYKFLPNDYRTVHVGLMSLEMSDGAGLFSEPPVLTIDFQQVHDTDGLALRFSAYTGDYASAMDVAFYDADLVLIRSDSYYPDSPEFSTGQAVEAFKRIVITFHATNRPYRYLRVTGIDFGELISFTGSEIKSARVVESVDPLSGELPYNTLDLTLHSTSEEFSIINPTGYYAALKERQPLAVYEQIDNMSLFIGNFYLDEWENASETESLFRAIDLLGVLDRQTYRGGMWLAGIAFEDLIEAILAPIHAPYEIDPALLGITVRGWLPIGSYREALQQVALAAGAVVTCARSGAIRFFPAPIAANLDASATITRGQIGLKPALALRPMVTAVEVTAHNYTPGSEERELLNETLPAGQHEITFQEPAHSLSVSGATIVESGANYAVLAVASTGAVVLTGKNYIDTQRVTRLANPDAGAGVRANVLEIKEATLVSSANVADVAGRVLDYHRQRYRQKMKLLVPTVEPGQVVVADTQYSKHLRGVIERMSLDLTRGFVVEAEMTGVVHELD